MKRWLSRAKETVLLGLGAIALLVYLEWMHFLNKRNGRKKS